jgi:hypothetical protein
MLKVLAGNVKANVVPDAGWFSDLKLPDGRTLGQVDTDSLRREFARLGIDGAHTFGRNVLCEKYAAKLMEVGEAASEAAIAAFLESKRV